MSSATAPITSPGRDVVFISKGTPDDDEFVLWLAPRLESHGYKVFADILTLKPGDRWRKEITVALQNNAIKMLLCCTDTTLNKNGVQEEIGIAEDLTKQLPDPNFIIPLKLARFKKVFGIGGLQYIDFENRWAAGLVELLDALRKQGVPCEPAQAKINPNWETYRRRLEIKLEPGTERLTSNWLRIAEMPDVIRYFQPTGSVSLGALIQECRDARHPAEPFLRGFFSFGTEDEINETFARTGRFSMAHQTPLLTFVEKGLEELGLQSREATNLVTSMLRRAWENYCRERNLLGYAYSQVTGFHVAEAQLPIGKKVSWGRQGDRRSAMLRNKAQGKIWQFGVSALPSLFPFWHFRLKARVLFAEADGDDQGKVFEDKKLQHRYRRTICKGWRNKQWHGRLMAFMELLSGDMSALKLPLSPSVFVKLDATPTLFTSPVTTVLPDALADEDEEQDDDTLAAFVSDDQDDED